MSDFVEELAKLIEQPAKKPDEGDELALPEDYEDQVASIFANGLAAAVSEVEERLGFQGQINSVDSAVKFVTHFITVLRVRKRDQLRKALRRYERLGHDKFRRDYRRKLAKGYEREEE